ncbi:MAG: hypothetical protein V4686_02195 [Patescibacteria group bacterium]
MKLFNTNKHRFIFAYFIVALSSGYSYKTFAASVALYPEINKQNTGIENYAINIFCTEILNKKYIKAVTGSGVFLSNPDDQKNIILTNAHVARHLLDKNKKCVGRTGNPAATTHSLVLRYIPSFWLQENGAYIIGDPNKNSTGEFDFAIVETNRIQPKKKTATLYEIFKPTLKLQLKQYTDTTLNTSGFSKGLILSYPADKTLSKNIYNPLYLKHDSVQIKQVYSSPTLREEDSLIDTIGSTNIDHGSSGGMVVMQGVTNNLIGLSSVLIQANNPQIVRVITLKHIFSVIEKELNLSKAINVDVFVRTLREAQANNLNDTSLISMLKNQKLTATLEQQTRITLYNLGIISK